jgi:replicative DNA helicase
MIASWSQIMLGRVIAGSLNDYEAKKVLEVCGKMSHLPLHIDDTPGRSVMQIASMARRIKRTEKGLALIVIDYLQLIEPSDQRDMRQEQVAKISRRLKVLARELNVPILVLAQLNRQAEASGDNRPKLSHLRESGAIEQDADVVLFVHRPEYYCTTDEERKPLEGKAYIIVAKQRNGMAGVDVECLWQRDFQRFVNVSHAIPSHDLSVKDVVPQESDPFDFPE